MLNIYIIITSYYYYILHTDYDYYYIYYSKFMKKV